MNVNAPASFAHHAPDRSRPGRRSSTPRGWKAVLAAVVIPSWVALSVSCAEETNETETPPPLAAEELDLHRTLAAAYFEEERYQDACDTLTRICAHANATSLDRLHRAIAELFWVDGSPQLALDMLAECRRERPEDPAVLYSTGLALEQVLDFRGAGEAFEQCLTLDPDDLPSRAHLAACLEDRDLVDDSIPHHRWIVEHAQEYAPGFHSTSVYRLGQILSRKSDPALEAEGIALLELKKALDGSGVKPESEKSRKRGRLARISPAPPQPQHLEGPLRPAPSFELQARLAVDVGAPSHAFVADLEEDGDVDLVVAGRDGVVTARWDDARYDTQALSSQAFEEILPCDWANSGHLTVLACGSDETAAYLPTLEDTFVDGEISWPDSIDALKTVDFDHDGDVDLLGRGINGLFLLRNDGPVQGPLRRPVPEGDVSKPSKTPRPNAGLTPRPVLWTDVSERLRESAGDAAVSAQYEWLAIEDFDGDQDVDFLAGGDGLLTTLFSSQRAGRFLALTSEETGLPDSLTTAPVLHDLNGDGSVDVATADGVLFNRWNGTFEAIEPRTPLSAQARWLTGDIDLDGRLDALLVDGESTTLVQDLAHHRVATPVDLPHPPIALADLDGDGDLDLVLAAERGVQLWRSNAANGRHVLRVHLSGQKDNRQGVGAIVEVRAGDVYERRFARQPRLAFGVDADTVDVVRVTWNNGIIQYPIQQQRKPYDPTTPLIVRQKPGSVESCPFLYTWDGTRYTFVSDFLGITPLGLLIGEGTYVPPDHDELVRITSDQLQPLDGTYRLQLTEELREVTYLDAAQLWVVDHPDSCVLHPEERFTFPPFPPSTLHALQPQPIVRAVGSDGKDWTEAVRTPDDRYAAPFDLAPRQFRGLAAAPHTLTLTLPEEARSAPRIRLLLTGWLEWTDATINLATEQHPQYAFEPPVLAVPDGDGGWTRPQPPVGFPAGKTKTMVLDVTDLVVRDDPRIRIETSLCVAWDHIEVAFDIGDDPLRITKLGACRADLQWRGISAAIPYSAPNQPEWFDFERLVTPRWNQHVGMLTKYGDVRPLLGEVDDCFAIFSAGDAIDLRFDATQAPALEDGQARTFLLFVDGWAKDGNLATAHGGVVEPLPFHAMSGYPYGPDESYPEDELHRTYRDQWNTRPGRRLVPDLSSASWATPPSEPATTSHADALRDAGVTARTASSRKP